MADLAKSTTDFLDGIPAWSLVAEIIYYLLYPALAKIAQKIGWGRLFTISFVVSLLFALTIPISNVNYPAWGYAGDWLIGMPCWLLGVLLAEQIQSLSASKPASLAEIITWRLSAIMLGAMTHNLALQRIIGQHLTLNFFAIFAFFWLKREIRRFQIHPTNPILESLGATSYSLYLMHVPIIGLVHASTIPNLGYGANWLLHISIIISGSLIFYFAIERPSHAFARNLSRAAST